MRKHHFFLVSAIVIGVLAGSYIGWLIYKKGLSEVAHIFVSADEDPSSTIGNKTESLRSNIIIDGTVTGANNNPQSGTINIAGRKYAVNQNGKFSASIEPGVLMVTFVRNGIDISLSPQVTQFISSGSYNFIAGE